MKKFLTAGILAAALIFTAAPNTAAAEDVFVGPSPATGWRCYVMTETFRRDNVGTGRSITLKMITKSGKLKYLDYYFWRDSDFVNKRYIWRFENSQGYKGIIGDDTPIESAMFEVIKRL